MRQTREITESFPQLTGDTQKYWDKFIELLRLRYDEVTTARTKDGKKLTWSETIDRIRFISFNPQSIDRGHVDRVVNAANTISKTRIVIYGSESPGGVVFDKKGRFLSTNLLGIVDYEYKKLTIEFPHFILKQFFGKELSVEYDAHVKSLLKTKFAPVLYQRCCIFEIGLQGFLEMTEDDIRLALGFDFVSDYEKINNQIIRDKDKLQITKGKEYKDRFERIYNKIIEPACAEINKLASEEICPFSVVPEILSESTHCSRRGAPSKEHTIKFNIYRFSADDESCKDQIEDAVAVEISPESITPSPVSGTQVEMELNFSDDSDLTRSLVEIRDKITTILTASKATHTKKYVPGILKQIKERCSVCPELPSMVLAWIKYSEETVRSNRGKDSEVSKFLQSNLKYHCQLYHKGSTYTGDRLPEYPPGYEPTVIRVTPSEGDNQENQYTFTKNNSYGHIKPNSAEARRAKLDRDAEEACRRVLAMPYTPKVY